MRLPRWLRWRSHRELTEEIEAHLNAEIETHIDRGLSPDEARYAARRSFGNTTRMQESIRESDPLFQLETLARDVRYGLRHLLRTPFLALAVVLTLTLGIGLNTTVFTILNALFIRPLVTKDPASFAHIVVESRAKGRTGSTFATPAEYAAFRNASSFREVTASARNVRVAAGADAPVVALLVSCNYLAAHYDAPILGRTFLPEECSRPGGEPVAVLNEAYWRSSYGADPGVIGRPITMGRLTLTIVGVVPMGMVVETLFPSVWAPLSMQSVLGDEFIARNPDAVRLDLTARLKPGVRREQAQAELAGIAAGFERDASGATPKVRVTSGSVVEEEIGGPDVKQGAAVIALVLVAGGLVLVMVCSNVTTLLLARAAARRQEMAVRASLGAGRSRLIRQLLTESLLLAFTAAAAGLWIATHAPALVMDLPGVPMDRLLAPDWRVFAFTFSVALFAGCLAGLSPALESLRFDLAGSLKPVGRGGGGHARSRIRGVLIATQLCVSLVALISIAVVGRAQMRLFKTDFGYDPKTIVVPDFNFRFHGYDDAARRDFYRRLAEQLESAKGVRSVALVDALPFRDLRRVEILPDGGTDAVAADWRQVTRSYFDMFRVRLVRGRLLTEAEVPAGARPLPVVVSEAFVRRAWRNQDPLGKRFKMADPPGDPQARVVNQLEFIVTGVAADTSSVEAGAVDGPLFYALIPSATAAQANTIAVQASGTAETAIQAIRGRARQLDPRLNVSTITMATLIDRQAELYKAARNLVSIPGGLMLVLALLGIYGVGSYTVTQRFQEIGVRLALGAQRGDIIRLFLRSTIRPMVAGIAGGMLIALALAVMLDRVQVAPGLGPFDPLAYTAAVIVVSGAGLLATFVPTRRASRMDPWRTLRDE